MGPDVDPNYGDELAEYREHDRIGIGGAEAWFEQRLRGRRGRVIERPDGSRSRLEPVAGQDVALTLDGTLQRRIYALLRETVETLNRAGSRNKPYQPCPGAAAVLLYMPPHQPGTPPRREALAVVSYPSYDPATYGDEYQELVRETWTLPLTSRAVDQPYPPGSTVKPMVLAAALTEGLTTRDRRIPCNGIFGSRNPRRCWIVFRNMTQHRDLPTLDAEMSLAQSCNSYYYTIGSQLGTDRLWSWFNNFGIGVSKGSRTRRGGSALNLTIGQGLVDATPLQVANMIASVATGGYVPVSFRLGPEPVGSEPAMRLDVRDEHWRLIRKGLWHVVNGAHGTARNYARLDSEAYELCGKTGTAQSWSRAVEYAFHCTFADGRKETIFATDQYSALQRVTTHDPPTITPGGARRKYPPSPSPPHAWFVGYIQPKGAPPSQPPHVALAVILEYAGSGSRQAAPVAKSIAELVIERGRDYVTGTAPSGREGR